MKNLLLFQFAFVTLISASAQNNQNNTGSNHGNRFEQLGTMLPTPNEYRTASGAPGPKYWQQRCDYDIKCELNEEKLRLDGSETLSYFNNSPDILRYLWLQMDENQHSTINNGFYSNTDLMPAQMNESAVKSLEEQKSDNKLGFNLVKITDVSGKALTSTLNKTMLRLDLPAPIKPGQKFVFNIQWNYKISDRMVYGGRGGFELFPGDGNRLFTIAQWYPRLCVYSDFQGWQNKQFAGRGEFALTFGNFHVQITVPADLVVGATGECLNYQQNLNPSQMARWTKAQSAKEPVEIVTLAEATAAEKTRSSRKKTWIYKADNVRDFAWTASRKFIWDAMPTYVEGKKIMCMSFYGKEAYPLYRQYSTKAVAHTIRTYSKFSIPYPYPVAQSVEAANGMEYPMICFNFGRAEKDGTYNEATKYGMIGVIIHEVGHNFFPMIVNSDERQWTWMDEGLNTYLEYLTEELWDNQFPVRRGPAYLITDYMKLPKNELEPIMTNSENILAFGPNAYSKPATGLNILRETIVGRKLFDFAFREYARRWAFKHPTPADLFRTLEDASGEDLDWFWRGWFYCTEACDQAIDTVKYFRADPDAALSFGMKDTVVSIKLPKPLLNKFDDISKIRNRQDTSLHFETDRDTTLRDFYWKYARGLYPSDTSITYDYAVPAYAQPLDEAAKLKITGKYFYELVVSNKGGLVMPVIIEWTFIDGTKEVDRLSVEIWRLNENKMSKVFLKDKEVVSVKLDPMRETADIDESNNSWGKISQPSKFSLFKTKQQSRGQSTGLNPMQEKSNQKKLP